MSQPSSEQISTGSPVDRSGYLASGAVTGTAPLGKGGKTVAKGGRSGAKMSRSDRFSTRSSALEMPWD